MISTAIIVFSYQNCSESKLVLPEAGSQLVESDQSAAPPQLVTQPVSSKVQFARDLELSVMAVGDGPLSYQWFFNGIPVSTASDSPALIIDYLMPQDRGSYHVEVTNASGKIISEPIVIQPAIRSACHSALLANESDGDGVYLIDPDGENTGIAPFEVYCDMTTDGGGWTLVDNDAATDATFMSRSAGANSDISVTKGSYLPGYTWSASPQMMVKASQFTGNLGWVTFNATNNNGLEYPTATTTTSNHNGAWTVATLNNNTNRGATSFIFTGTNRVGNVWIGNGQNPTAACAYTSGNAEAGNLYRTGLGGEFSAITSTCSTWVR